MFFLFVLKRFSFLHEILNCYGCLSMVFNQVSLYNAHWYLFFTLSNYIITHLLTIVNKCDYNFEIKKRIYNGFPFLSYGRTSLSNRSICSIGKSVISATSLIDMALYFFKSFFAISLFSPLI